MEAFVPNERTLLVTDQATDLNALERPVFNLAVHLRRRDDLGEDGWFYAEELQEHRVPLQGLDVHQQRSRGVRNFCHMQLPVCQTLRYVLGGVRDEKG